MKISVIICTFNPRAEYLLRTLDALSNQTLAMEHWELLLIDNASKVPVSEQFDISWCLNGRHLREDKSGKLNAMLLGFRESSGGILVFVDDDNVLAPDYLEQALFVSEDWPLVGVWGGNIVPEFEIPMPTWCAPMTWMLTIDEIEEDTWSSSAEGSKSIPSGTGMCIRRVVANFYLNECQQNPGRMMLDRHGEGLEGYGDTDLAYCAFDMSLGTGKSTRLQITHLIPSSRLTLDYFSRRSEADAASLQLFRAMRRLPIKNPKQVVFINFFRWILHRLIRQVPREQYEITKARQRGLVRGWKLAQKYLHSKASTPKPNP